MEIPCKNKHRNISRINYFLVLIIILMSIPIVSAFEFDNIKRGLTKNKDTSEYGLIEIRNSVFGWDWFQLDKIMSLELKENTEACLPTGCSANTEIIMYENGKLIDDIRFIDLETGKETNIKNYNIYVNGDLYNYEEVSGNSVGVKYAVELKGKLNPFQEVDWQIKSAGTDWIDDWAFWTSALNVDLLMYYNSNDSSGNLTDSLGNVNMTKVGTPLSVAGAVNNATYSTGDDYWIKGNMSVGNEFNLTDSNFTINFWVYRGNAEDKYWISDHPAGPFYIFTTSLKLRVAFEGEYDYFNSFLPKTNTM